MLFSKVPADWTTTPDAAKLFAIRLVIAKTTSMLFLSLIFYVLLERQWTFLYILNKLIY